MFANLNFVALGLAVIVSMSIGAAWYGLLAKPWMAANGFSDEQRTKLDEGGNPSTYIITAISHLVMAYVLNGVIYHSGGHSLRTGIISALFIWVGFVATTMSVNHRFQMKPWKLTFIDAGHYLAVLLAQGAILGWFGI
ncbi:DUF1761 domain-containing protein [Ahrensia sp. AH-315-G08]|nr:DUF1761 domain-containing protein [Ahrensia sp. AH-315-G08]